MQMHEHATRYRAVLLPAMPENSGRPTVEKSRPQLRNLWPWKELSCLRVTTTVSAPRWRSRWFGVRFVALCVSILRIYTRLCRELNAGRNKERRGERRIKAKKRRKKKKKKNKGKRAPLQRRGGGVEETVEENLFCISTNLRAGRTRPVAQPSSSTSSVRFARREVSTPESCFMISTKSRLSPLYFLLCSPNGQSAPSMQYHPSSLGLLLRRETVSPPFPISYRRIYCRHRSVHCNEDCLWYWLFLLC